MKTTVKMKKEQRGHMATQTAATEATNAAAKEGLVHRSPSEGGFTTAEKNACSIDAMLNGGECKACQ